MKNVILEIMSEIKSEFKIYKKKKLINEYKP